MTSRANVPENTRNPVSSVGVRWGFIDAPARANFVPLWGAPNRGKHQLRKRDLGSLAWQISDDSFYVLTGLGPNWTSLAPTASAVLPDFTQEVTIASGGGPPTTTVDIPIGVDGTTYANLRATAIDQVNGLELAYACFVAVKRVGGTLSFPFGSFLEQVVVESGLTWDSTWVARTLSSSNIRLTLKGDTTHNVKWRVEADFRIVPFPA